MSEATESRKQACEACRREGEREAGDPLELGNGCDAGFCEGVGRRTRALWRNSGRRWRA